MFGSVQFDSIETVVRVRFGFSISNYLTFFNLPRPATAATATATTTTATA